VGSRFPLLLESKKMRDKAKEKFVRKQIGVSTGHDKWLKEVELIRPYLNDIRDEEFRGAIDFQDRMLTLPAHERVTEKNISIIYKILKEL
jgi:dTDP-4-amino-4,6-dideoxygalactose transaminase